MRLPDPDEPLHDIPQWFKVEVDFIVRLRELGSSEVINARIRSTCLNFIEDVLNNRLRLLQGWNRGAFPDSTLVEIKAHGRHSRPGERIVTNI